MSFGSPSLLVALALVVVGFVIAMAVRYLSPEARRERRRRRSHSRVISKAKRPAVSFRVRTKK